MSKPDTLDAALAFVIQAAQRHADAKSAEMRAHAAEAHERFFLVTKAEKRTNATAATLDTACDEYNQQIRDYVKSAVMAAVAAMQDQTVAA
jgi:hypothetical protein